MEIIAIPPQIIQEAKVLRTRLGKGSINILELNNFLERVEHFASPSSGKKIKKKAAKKDQLFANALERLNK